MATLFYTTDSIGSGTRIWLSGTNDLYVLAGVNIFSSDNCAIISQAAHQTITIMGHVAGAWGISVYDYDDNTIIIGAGATITASAYGIYAFSDGGVIFNHGTINAGYIGVRMSGDAVRFVNTGIVESNDANNGPAVMVSSISGAPETEALTINRGTFIGTTAYYGDYGFGDKLVNHGSIIGDIQQAGGNDILLNRGGISGNVDAGADDDRVDNRGGLIDGDVHLGDGNDRFDNRGGTVFGAVSGDAGDDIFIGNPAMAEVFDGGAGSDLLNFRFGSAVRVALDGSFENTGAALGDVYTGFERVQGSSFNDVIRGSSSANQLFGQDGNDRLDGAAGNDNLTGGLGTDTLAGGSGNDSFRFNSLAECGDVITDFRNVTGNDDRFVISSAGFGGGLSAGPLPASAFLARADNLAQDADDRFIFRTTDQSLWFDADGNGAGARVMVADLQAGATMTAADIILV